MASILAQLSILLVGLLTGGMLLIGGGLLPYWQSLEPMEFSRWFGANSRFLAGLMLPLGRAAVIISLLTAIAAWATSHPGARWLTASTFLVLFIAALYAIYYAPANALLGSGSLSPAEVSAELATWRIWHWIRVAAGVAAVVAGLRGLTRVAQR